MIGSVLTSYSVLPYPGLFGKPQANRTQTTNIISFDVNKSNPLGSCGEVSAAYASLLQKVWSGEYSILAPRLLKQTVASFAPQFDNSYQHDSQEFCQFLLDGLHEDLNRVKKKPYVEELEGFGRPDHETAIESWRKHLLRHDSVIVDYCQGMHRSHLTCPHCGRESIKFDVYSSISLPLVDHKDKMALTCLSALQDYLQHNNVTIILNRKHPASFVERDSVELSQSKNSALEQEIQTKKKMK